MKNRHDSVSQAIIYRADILERLELSISQPERDDLVMILAKLDKYILEQS